MICYRCKQPKTTKGNSLCGDCKKEYDQKYYSKEENRKAQIERVKKRKAITMPPLLEWYRSLKDAPCVDCDTKYHFAAMEWDHLPGSVKTGNISRMIRAANKEAILMEIAKCDLVCANCHAIRTYERSNSPLLAELG